MNFPHRSGPAAQAVSVKRMEPTAQAQLGPLGLTGFIVVTTIATGIDAGIFPEKLAGSELPMVGFFIGGLAQLLAGLFQAQRGDTWHATVFGGFGLFWMAKGLMIQWVLPTVDPALRGDTMGLFTLPWVFVVFVLWLGSLRIHLALLTTFTFVLVVFVAMTCNGFTGEVIWNRVAGWAGLCAAAGALYLLAGQIMASTWGRAVLPMGRFVAPEMPES
ncbi:acetate uptake transporter [Streptomyces sp. NBC_01465]|uniref:acetate uptake transporter n=1 Tax=Streptomyces sp. NBC_01465 TaxID=2903878 RepID=UPI002E34CEB6|nr:acetate uptake transporter [Streptomyces sp. NBC_01465]